MSYELPLFHTFIFYFLFLDSEEDFRRAVCILDLGFGVIPSFIDAKPVSDTVADTGEFVESSSSVVAVRATSVADALPAVWGLKYTGRYTHERGPIVSVLCLHQNGDVLGVIRKDSVT